MNGSSSRELIFTADAEFYIAHFAIFVEFECMIISKKQLEFIICLGKMSHVPLQIVNFC